MARFRHSMGLVTLWLFLVTVAMGASPATASSPTDGTPASAFMTNYASSGFSLLYSTAAEQPDGKILVGGENNGSLRRLNADGTADTAFNAAIGTGFTDTQYAANVTAIEVQPDGGILVGGQFNRFNGVAVGPVVRLTSAGALDTSFSSNAASVVGQRRNSSGLISLQAIAVSSGKIYIGGSFTGGSAGTSYLIQLTGTGTQAMSSYSLIDGTVAAIEPLSDGSTLLGGSFTGWGMSRKVMRIDATDQIDTSFAAALGVPDGDVYSIAQIPNGDIYYGGDFTNIGSVSSGRVAKSSSAGILDTTFGGNLVPGFDDTVLSVAPQLDGRVFVVGQFQSRNGVAAGFGTELNANGTVDTTFMGNFGTGFNNFHTRAITLSTGNILAFGRFGQYNGASVNALVNINAQATYTLRYQANGGTGTLPVNQTFLSSATVASGSSLNRPGYTFQRWNTAQGGTGANYDAAASYTTAADATLWAVWAANSYSVTYLTGSGASSVSPGTYSTGGSFVAASAPTRTGYSFTEWTITDSDSSTHVVNAGASYSPVGHGAITVSANWATTPYSVTYQANGATGSVSPTSFDVTTPATIAVGTTLSYPGYSFSGWNTNSYGTGTDYDAGTSYSSLSNLVLHAKWSPTTQTLTYDANGGTGSVTGGTYTTGGQALTVASEGAITRDGYEFAGWNTLRDGTGVTYAAGSEFTGVTSETLYAQWTAVSGGFASLPSVLAKTGYTVTALLGAQLLSALGLLAIRLRTLRKGTV